MRGENIRLGGEDFANPYVEERKRRSGERSRVSGKLAMLGIACTVMFLAMVLLPGNVFSGTSIGSSEAATYGDDTVLASFARGLRANFEGLVALLTTGNAGTWELYFFPFVCVVFSGASMALCGSVYQSAFRNPLAAPKTLGVMGGGALGTLVWVLFFRGAGPQFRHAGFSYNMGDQIEWLNSLGPLDHLWIYYSKALFSVAGCLAVVAVVVGIAAIVGRGRISNIVLIICGQIFAVGATSLIQFLRRVYTSSGDTDLANTLMEIEGATFNSTFDFEAMLMACVPMAVCIAIIMLMRNRLALLTLPDDEARSMGISVNKMRYAMVAVCTVMVGWSISFCGHIAFLGFITAHISRKVMGPDVRYLLPASCFIGAMFLLVVHKVTTLGLFIAPLGTDGMWTSVAGSALFLILTLRESRRPTGDWH